MSHHMTLHEDVLERILNILKQDDYYRTLEDLPVIDELTAYDDIRLFPELYDTSTIIERVTAEADLIERQLRRPGIYPQHTNLSHPTSYPPKPTPNFQPTSTNNNTNNTSNNQNNTTPSYRSTSQHSNNNSGYGYSKSNQQEKLVNVSVTLHGPVSKEQLYKIQEVLRHPSQYTDRIKPEDCPVKGEYATAFNKFCPKKVEVNEATVKEAIKYGQFLKKSKEDIAEAIDIYKTLGNEMFYGPEEDPADQQEQPPQ